MAWYGWLMLGAVAGFGLLLSWALFNAAKIDDEDIKRQRLSDHAKRNGIGRP